MNIIDFLYENYLWILAILAIAIFTTIGFIADKKSKNKKGNVSANVGASNNNQNISNLNNNGLNNPTMNTNASAPLNTMNNGNINNGMNTSNGLQTNLGGYNAIPNGQLNIANSAPTMINPENMNNQNIPNNMNGGMVNNFTNVGTNPMASSIPNQVPSQSVNENITPNNFTNVAPVSPNNQNVEMGFPNVNMIPSQPTYNNTGVVNSNPNMVVNSWDEPIRTVNPVNINIPNIGTSPNNMINQQYSNVSSQIPIQESIPINTESNNNQPPINNVGNGNNVPGLNFVYGPNQNNNGQ